MAKEIIIELGKEASTKLLERDTDLTNLNFLQDPPFNKFTTTLKFSDILDSSGLKRQAKAASLNLEVFNQMMYSNLNIKVLIQNSTLSAEIVLKEYNKTMFKFTVNTEGRVKINMDRDFSMPENIANFQAAKFLKLIVGVIDYIKTPNTYIRKEVEKEPRGYTKRGKKGKKAKKSYIYKTHYIIEHLNSPKLPATSTPSKESISEREYSRLTKEWERRGHYRYYRNPDGSVRKMVWIKGVRCKAKREPLGDKTYKITKI